MSDQEIIDTIAAHCIGGCSPMCGPKFCPCNDQAKLILAALRERYAIVELPKPDRCVEETRDENAHQQWDYPHGHITAFSDGEIHWGNWSSVRPEKVRKAAAALLAAANYAEEGK